MLEEEGCWLGVDFGTTHSCVTVWDSTRGHPKWIRLASAAPSSVSGRKEGRVVPTVVLVTQVEIPHAVPLHTMPLYAVIGHPAVQLLQESYSNGSSPWSPDDMSAAIITSFKRRISPQVSALDTIRITPLGCSVPVNVLLLDLVAVFLKGLRLEAQLYLQAYAVRKSLQLPNNSIDYDCNHVVLGVPANFTQSQRSFLSQAANQAGFVTSHTLTESSAAAMAYGLSNQQSPILVLDMGGGTTDVTIAVRDHDSWKVAVTVGATVGGDDLDRHLLNYVLSEHAISKLASSMERKLVIDCRRAKEQLCGDVDHGDTVPAKSVDLVIQGLRVTVDQTTFTRVIQPSLVQVRETVLDALERYRQSASEFPSIVMQEVILVGGSTRVPEVREMMRKLFPCPPHRELCLSVNPLSAVAQGTAIQAALDSTLVPEHVLKSAMMLDALPYAIGVMTGQFVPVLPKNATLPARGHATFELANSQQVGVTVNAVEEVASVNGIEYPQIQEFTFLLHRMSKKHSDALNGKRYVDIGMLMTKHGELVVSIFDPNDPEQVRKKAQYEKQSGGGGHDANRLGYKTTPDGFTKQQWLLLFLTGTLFVLYVWAKIVFSDVKR